MLSGLLRVWRSLWKTKHVFGVHLSLGASPWAGGRKERGTLHSRGGIPMLVRQATATAEPTERLSGRGQLERDLPPVFPVGAGMGPSAERLCTRGQNRPQRAVPDCPHSCRQRMSITRWRVTVRAPPPPGLLFLPRREKPEFALRSSAQPPPGRQLMPGACGRFDGSLDAPCSPRPDWAGRESRCLSSQWLTAQCLGFSCSSFRTHGAWSHLHSRELPGLRQCPQLLLVLKDGQPR